MGSGPGPAPDRHVLWNPFANMAGLAGHAVTIVSGDGATVFDSAGRPYLDALASLWYCNVGHGRGELADAAAAQMRRLAGYQIFESYSNPPAEELARRLAALAPVRDAKVFLTPGGGSDAVETAAKLARAYWRAAGQPDKLVTIGRSHAYHGMNAYGTSLGGIPANADADDPFRVSHTRRVEYIPSRAGRPTQEGFEHRVKIRRLQPPGIGTDIARGNAERPAERNAKVSKIPADTRALRNGIVGRGQRIRRTADIIDVVVYPVANCHHPLIARARAAERALRETL